MFEVVIESGEIVVRDIDPLQILQIVNNASQNCVQACQFSQFVIAEHQRRADQFYMYCFLFLFLQLLFGLEGDVLHG